MKQFRIYKKGTSLCAIKVGFSWVGLFFGIFHLPITITLNKNWIGFFRLIFIMTIGYFFGAAIYLFVEGLISFVTNIPKNSFIDFAIHLGQMILYIAISMLIGFFIGAGILNFSDKFIMDGASSQIVYYTLVFLPIIIILIFILSYISQDTIQKLLPISIIIFVFPILNLIFSFFGNALQDTLCRYSNYQYKKIINANTKSASIDIFLERKG